MAKITCQWCSYTVDDSTGELKAANLLYQHIKRKHPDKL
jgi:hypothetical protein